VAKDYLYPIRRMHGILHDYMYGLRRVLALVLYTVFPFGKKVFVIGSPTHSNVGDSAIVYAQMKYLEHHGFPTALIKEFTLDEFQRYKNWIIPFVGRKNLISLPGGGNMGNQWLNEELFRRDVLSCFPNNPTIVFPQTIYYSDDVAGQQEAQKSLPFYTERQNLILVAREQISFDQMAEYYPGTKLLLTPDIVLSAGKDSYVNSEEERKGILFCMRSDAERSIDDKTVYDLEVYLRHTGKDLRYSDMHTAHTVTKQTRKKVVCEKMREFLSSELVITDRLHGMIFAAVTGTPCVAFNNYNHKISGTYQWLKELKYIRFANSTEEAKEHIMNLLEIGPCIYDPAYLAPYYDKLAEVVKNYACN